MQRANSLARYKHLLEVDPESLGDLLQRIAGELAEQDREVPEVQLSTAEWRKLTQIVKAQLERFDEAQVRLLALELLAEIYEHRLGEGRQAFRWWGQALLADPRRDLAADELERLARTGIGWRELVRFYEDSMRRTKLQEVAPLLRRLARVQEVELQDDVQAEKAYRSLLEHQQADPEALIALDRIYSDSGRFQDLAGILEQKLAATQDRHERVAVGLRLGMVFEEIHDAQRAVGAYRGVVEVDPHNRQALRALEQLYLRQKRWQDLLAIYETTIDLAQGTEEIVDLAGRISEVPVDAPDNAERVRRLLGQILEDHGKDPQLLGSLAALHEAKKRYANLATVLEWWTEVELEPTARCRLFRWLGEIYSGKLKDAKQALKWWHRVLESEPGELGAMLAIADLYSHLEDWEELLAMLHRIAETGAATGREIEFIKQVRRQIAQLEQEVTNRLEPAIEAWYEVIALDSEEVEALETLDKLLAQASRWEERIQILEKRRQLATNPKDQVDLLVSIATIWLEQLDDASQAARTCERALALDPKHRSAFETLCGIHRQLGQPEQLVTLLFSRLDAVDTPKQAIDLLSEVAGIYEEQLDQPQEAFLVWQTALKQDFADLAIVTRSLERLAATTGRWEELLAAFEGKLEETIYARAKVDLLTRTARVRRVKLGQLEQAVAAAVQALHLDPESIPALEELGQCYREAERWAELVGVLQRHADLAPDPSRSVELLREIARLFEASLGDLEQAAAALRKILQLESGDAEALASLATIYRQQQRWEPLMEILRRQVEGTDEAAALIALKCQMGLVYEGPLQELQRAIDCFEQVLELEPSNQEAVEALERLYDATGRSELYLDVVERRVDLSESAEDKLTMYPRIAEAWEEKFSRTDRAIGCLEKLLPVDGCPLEIYVELEQLCRKANANNKLAEVLKGHIAVVDDLADRIDLHLELGKVLEGPLQQPKRAIDVYLAALALDPDHVSLLDVLARLYERLQSWEEAVEQLGRMANLVDDAERADILFRLGLIHEERLQQIERAEGYYLGALGVDERHFDSMERLIEIYKARGEWEMAMEVMVRAVPCTKNPKTKARLLHEAAITTMRELDDEQRATALLAQTLEVDPDHREAGLPLAEIYFRNGRYEELEPVLDMLSRKVDPRDKQTLLGVHYKLARSCVALGKKEKAIKSFRAAQRYDVRHLPTLSGLGALLYDTEDWNGAFKVYQTMLVNHRPSLQQDQVVEYFYRLGTIKLKLAERRKALNYFEKALEEDRGHAPTLQAVIQVRTHLGDWRAVASAKETLARVVTDDQERFTLLTECGELHRERLLAPQEAIAAYRAALDLRPDDRELLLKMLDLLTSEEQWDEAVAMLHHMASTDDKPEVQAKYFYTGGVISRDSVGDNDRAVELFNLALDLCPDELKAFEAIDRIYTERKDWAALERNYRRMIQRQPEGEGRAGLNAMLWHNLGEIYRTRMRRTEEAITAFETAVGLEPQNEQRHEILAELYHLAGPKYVDKAIAELQLMLGRSPEQPEPYRALQRVYAGAGRLDSAWCCSAALVYLQRADEQERKLFAQHNHQIPARPRSRIPDGLWPQIRYHRQDPRVGGILGSVGPAVVEMMARPVKEFGLKRKARVDLVKDLSVLAQVFNNITMVLGLTDINLYLQPNPQAELLLVANTKGSPSIIIDPRLAESRSPKELAFLLGQRLTHFRQEYLLTQILPSPAQLRTVLLAALKLGNPHFAIQPNEAVEVDKLVEHLAGPGGMDPGTLVRLGNISRELADPARELDVGRWLQALTRTANRVGLIFCGDLQVATGLIGGPVEISSKKRSLDLLKYSVSEDYFKVRRELGLAIG